MVLPRSLAIAVCALCGVVACSTNTSLRLLDREQAANPIVDVPTGGASSPMPSDMEADAMDPERPPGDVTHDDDDDDSESPVEDSGVRLRGLSFKGPYDRVEVASVPAFEFPPVFTLEAWVFVRSFTGGHVVFNRWVPGGTDVGIFFGVPEHVPEFQLPEPHPVPSRRLVAWVYNGTSTEVDSWATVYTDELPAAGRWHHLSMTYGDGALRLFADGELIDSDADERMVMNADSNFYIGACARNQRELSNGTGWWAPIDGVIRDVRLSNAVRYTADFTPSRRLLVDDETIALWPLDAGEGDTARDLGLSQLHGTIHGATWIDLAGPLGELVTD
jgi:hypothetical protein